MSFSDKLFYEKDGYKAKESVSTDSLLNKIEFVLKKGTSTIFDDCPCAKDIVVYTTSTHNIKVAYIFSYVNPFQKKFSFVIIFIFNFYIWHRNQGFDRTIIIRKQDTFRIIQIHIFRIQRHKGSDNTVIG